jgi:hypothetical protein
MSRSTRAMALGLATLLAAACGGADADPLVAPADAVAELLARDLAYAEASARTDVVSGVTGMLAAEPWVAVPGRGWVHGRDEFLAALRRDSTNATARLSWAPVRGGVSADGTHGFTWGYMTLHRADSVTVPMKYLAYWVRDGSDWKLLTWRRRPRAEGEVSTAILSPFAPGTAVAHDSAAVAAHAASVAAAEQAFSDEAQRIGLAAAFALNGRPDAINLGGPDHAAFVMGAEAIAAMVGEGEENPDASSVSWGADTAFAASSGDLGITLGMIRPNSGEGPSFPFFTVWAREDATQPWRYIAE